MSDKRELSRAELVRQRRAQRTAKEMQQTTQRALKPIAPVTSRVVPTRPVIKPKRVNDPAPFQCRTWVCLKSIYTDRTISHAASAWKLAALLLSLIAVLLGAAIYFAVDASLLPCFQCNGAGQQPPEPRRDQLGAWCYGSINFYGPAG